MNFIILAIVFALISPVRVLAQTATLSGVLGDKALLIVNGLVTSHFTMLTRRLCPLPCQAFCSETVFCRAFR